MPKQFKPQDKYFHRAKQMGYRARSVFKLQEIQDKFGVLKPGMKVLDIGAAPGSWLQYASEMVGPKGRLLGIDLSLMDPVADNVALVQADIFSEGAESAIKNNLGERVDAVLSDLAPRTSGIKDVDHYRSVELSQRAAELAEKFLRPGGMAVFKVFQGSDFDGFISGLREKFIKVRTFKPRSTRDRSVEIYIIARK